MYLWHTNKEELSGDVGVKDNLSWRYYEETQLKSYEKWAREIVESQLWSSVSLNLFRDLPGRSWETALDGKGAEVHWPSRTASSGVTDQQNSTMEEDVEMGKSDELKEKM